jgi:hypothetical protein
MINDIVGILTAISVISRRMAKKLALLEQNTSLSKKPMKKEGVTKYGK